MAKPRVFVASTCYDLGTIRNDLDEFLSGFGCEAILSDHGDVFFDPSSHSHDACLHEVLKSDALVLVIGGRYGGSYKDTQTSITYHEYLTAAANHIPIFAVIQKAVLHDHHTWLKNSKSPDITYPNTDDIKIFEFIDAVRKNLVNNAFTPFESSQDICDYLTKQFAGALHGFLNRYKSDQRLSNLDTLGITRVYANATADNEYLDTKLSAPETSVLRILAVNAEMLIRNRRSALMKALVNGCEIVFLIATRTSELVKEMEAMEIDDGRPPDFLCIPDLIANTEPALQHLRKDALDSYGQLTPTNKFGAIHLGHFNTQYRETMIIANNEWVWWTPHLNPARGDERPTFVAEGQNSRFVRLCVRHFESVSKSCHLKTIV